VMVTPTAHTAIADALDPHRHLPVFLVAQALIDAITGFHIHRGCLAIGERPPALDWHSVARDARRMIVLERIGNADNVGAMFRNGAAFGVDAVLLGPACTDPLYRKSIRTSMGASLLIPYATAAPWPAALGQLRGIGIATLALTPSPDARPLAQCIADLRGQRIAVVVGHEGEGLTRETLEACEYTARIPMAAGVDSLNVATALAIALYEVACTSAG
jgi:tRNA G18 (ribose-2'-O)-methylase SpoU